MDIINYKFDLFEGPLDLLLHLIKQEEIEIKDIFVSQVTEQFLSYMKGLPYLDSATRSVPMAPTPTLHPTTTSGAMAQRRGAMPA